MSSPLSTLRKIRRVPLPETEGESRKYKDRTDTDYEAALFRESFPPSSSEKKLTSRTNRDVSVPSDMELMSSMMKKLTQLEKKVKAQTQEIDKKTRRIRDLEEKLRWLEEKAGGQKHDDDQLITRCQNLQKQILEMERFLNDYGMMWVGSVYEDEQTEDQRNWRPESSLVRRFSMDFDLVLKNILDLNLVAGEGSSSVTFVPGGAKLSRSSSVPLQLFKNGIVMSDGPFRSYDEPSTQQCMQDLMDGFFPSELQDSFPDGVIFQVIDRREEEYKAGFPGKGHRVGGAEREATSRFHHSWRRSPDRKSSVQHFLNKLPECVVRAGKVINIRSELRKHLQGSNSHVINIIETPALQSLSERRDSGTSRGDITSLRVKSEDGEKTFILKMFFHETIGTLRRYLDAHRGSCCSSYDIVSADPHQRVHGDDAQTLWACGLTPSASILLRPRPQ